MLLLMGLLFTTMVLDGCAVSIKDEQICSPIPGIGGAVCDNLLTSNPETYSETGWETLQASWGITECFSAQALGDFKEEIEHACSKIKCNEATKKNMLNNIQRLQNMRD